MIFWLIFLGHIPRKTTYGRRPKSKIFFIFFVEKMKKNDIFLVIFRGRRPMEDDLTNNLTSLDFPDACVSSIQLLLLLF